MAARRFIRFLFSLFFVACTALSGQVLQPVKWTQNVKKNSDGTHNLIFKAEIEKDWHLYSTRHKRGGIGIPTAFDFQKSTDYQLVGTIKEEGNLHDEFSAAFQEQQVYFSDKAIFTQNIKVNQPTKLEVEVMFQVCDDERCLPPDYKTFQFDLKPAESSAKNAAELKSNEIKENSSFRNEVESDNQEITDAEEDSTENEDGLTQNFNEISSEKIVTDKEVKEVEITNSNANRSVWEIFVFGFLGGFAALLMPCIFPMIPLTVSMFTKQSKSRSSGISKALIYGISIIVIYVLLGMLITMVFGPSALNALATNPWVNIAFFILFIVFAVSFFGAFEITLPSKWINKSDKAADQGGLIGIFFMALTLALVSFSCTGPIIGTLLVDSVSSGEKLGPAVGMFGFSLALALPFTLFALFPSWLNSLPKSGGWLNTVKVSLGFIELAFALKFLSNADLVLQMHWLEREVFLAAWIGIFLIMGLYILNIFQMKNDGNSNGIGWGRMLFGIFTFIFVAYMIPGLFGAPLKKLSGLIPPKHYSESPLGLGGGGTSAVVDLPEHAEFGPHQIPTFHDVEDAFAYAEKVNKPVMLDFTGDACANCRLVEDNVWSDPRVKEKLTKDVVLASLYVDRFIELPEEDKVYSEEKGRKLRTIGDKWSAYQIKYFKSNSQPLYILIDKEMNRYTEPMGAELDVEDYLEWIENGVENYKKQNP